MRVNATHIAEATAGYAGLEITGIPGVASHCTARVTIDALTDRDWLRAAKIGLSGTAPATRQVLGVPLAPPDRLDVLRLVLRRQVPGTATRSTTHARLRFRRDQRVPPNPMRCSAAEAGVDTLLRAIEDVETSYEHDLVTVHDDLRETLGALLRARRRSAARLLTLEKRVSAAARAGVDSRLARIEGTARHGAEQQYAALSRKVAAAAQGHATVAVRGGHTWRIPFGIFFASGTLFTFRLHAWYVSLDFLRLEQSRAFFVHLDP